MIIKDVELNTVCGYTSALPETGAVQIAFAGRSNVGKSSLINAIMNRKRLARVGSTPGKTRTINFYKVLSLCSAKAADDSSAAKEGTDPEKLLPVSSAESDPARLEKLFYLVDLPGYGYANVPETEKVKWGQMIERYLYSSKELKLVFLLTDIRHEPSKNDIRMYEWIRKSGCSCVIVATKADKIKRSQLNKQLKQIRTGLGARGDIPVIAFSSLTKSGVEEIRGKIEGFLQD